MKLRPPPSRDPGNRQRTLSPMLGSPQRDVTVATQPGIVKKINSNNNDNVVNKIINTLVYRKHTDCNTCKL